MQPLENCIGPTIRIGREILCLPYAGFNFIEFSKKKIVCFWHNICHFTLFPNTGRFPECDPYCVSHKQKHIYHSFYNRIKSVNLYSGKNKLTIQSSL